MPRPVAAFVVKASKYADELLETVTNMTQPGKGILAMDESNPTCGGRLEALGIENTEENRRRYRDVLLTTEGLGEHCRLGFLILRCLRLPQLLFSEPPLCLLLLSFLRFLLRLEPGILLLRLEAHLLALDPLKLSPASPLFGLLVFRLLLKRRRSCGAKCCSPLRKDPGNPRSSPALHNAAT